MSRKNDNEYIELYNHDFLKSIPNYDEIITTPSFLIDFNLICELITIFDNENDDDELFAILVLMHNDYLRRGGDSYLWYKLTAEKFAIALAMKETKQIFWKNLLDVLSFELIQLIHNKKDSRTNIEIADEIIEKMKSGEYHNPFIDGKKVIETIKRIIMRYYPDRQAKSIKKVLYDRINFRE